MGRRVAAPPPALGFKGEQGGVEFGRARQAEPLAPDRLPPRARVDAQHRRRAQGEHQRGNQARRFRFADAGRDLRHDQVVAPLGKPAQRRSVGPVRRHDQHRTRSRSLHRRGRDGERDALRAAALELRDQHQLIGNPIQRVECVAHRGRDARTGGRGKKGPVAPGVAGELGGVRGLGGREVGQGCLQALGQIGRHGARSTGPQPPQKRAARRPAGLASGAQHLGGVETRRAQATLLPADPHVVVERIGRSDIEVALAVPVGVEASGRGDQAAVAAVAAAAVERAKGGAQGGAEVSHAYTRA